MDQRVTTWDVSELLMTLDLSLCASYIPLIPRRYCDEVAQAVAPPLAHSELEPGIRTVLCFHAQCAQSAQLSPSLPARGSVRLFAKQFTDQWECLNLGSAC